MSEPIAVSFGEMSNASGEITGAAGKIEGQLGDLKARVDKVLAGYQGESADAYHAAQQAWDTAAADLQSVLNSIGIAVQQAGEAYAQAEKNNAGRW